MQEDTGDIIAGAIYESFKAMNEFDDAGENRANVVDALFFIGRAIYKLAEEVKAITWEDYHNYSGS